MGIHRCAGAVHKRARAGGKSGDDGDPGSSQTVGRALEWVNFIYVAPFFSIFCGSVFSKRDSCFHITDRSEFVAKCSKFRSLVVVVTLIKVLGRKNGNKGDCGIIVSQDPSMRRYI